MSTRYALVFGYSWPLSYSYSLERDCPSALLSANSAFARSHVPHWCSMGLSAPVHFCHMASPFPLETESYCHNVLCVDHLHYFSILHSVTTYNMQFSLFHLPLTTLEHLFLLHEWHSSNISKIRQEMIASDGQLFKTDSDPHKLLNNVTIYRVSQEERT